MNAIIEKFDKEPNERFDGMNWIGEEKSEGDEWSSQSTKEEASIPTEMQSSFSGRVGCHHSWHSC